MSLRFALSEGFGGMRRAVAMTLISTGTIALVVLSLGAFAAVVRHVESLLGSLRSQSEIEAFLREQVDSTSAAALQQQILSIGGVERVSYVSKERALEIFREQFGQDISRVLTFNPLPASIKVHIIDSALTARRVQSVVDEIRALPGVEDISYPRTVVEALDVRSREMTYLALVVGGLLAVAALFLVMNTVRLAMMGKRQMIELLLMAGATRGFVRGPFIVEGLVQGLAGGIIGSALLVAALDALNRNRVLGISWEHAVPLWFYGAVAALGILLGLVGSLLAVRSFFREAREG